MYSPTTEKLIKLFSKFPTVGPRTATRFVFYLFKQPKENIEQLIEAIQNIQEKIKICSLCGKSFETKTELCAICADPRRNKTILCIIEKEMDLEAIEKTNQFKGLYFILGSSLSKLIHKNKKQFEEKAEVLIQRIETDKIKEVILALNPTSEGQNTVLWLKRQLEPLQTKTTQLGTGLPVGGELEYADQETLSSALKNRN